MKVFYKRKYPIGSFLNEDIGFEIEVDDYVGQPEQQVLMALEAVTYLKNLCDKAHKELNPHLSENNVEPSIGEIDRKVGMVEAINACTDLDVLKTFSLLARNNPEHKEAYDKKFAELSK